MRLFYIVSDKFELIDVHEPQHFRVDNPQGTTYTPDQISTVCSSPPTGYPNYTVFSTPPFWGFAFHNETFIVRASYSYTKVSGGGGYPPMPQYQQVGPIEVSITVKFDNLIVQSQPEYLINNPGGDNHNTTITFQLQSAQKKLCSAIISIYTSTQQLVKQETLNNLLCPGTYTYTWDGKITPQYSPGSGAAPKGIYLYDIEVVGASPYDTDSRCSKALKITQTKSALVGGIDDCSQWDGSSTPPPIYPQVGYVLEDNSGKAAYSAKVTVFNGNMQMLGEENTGTATNLPNTSDPKWNDQTLKIQLVGRSPYVFLVSAIDDHPELDKAHRRKPALQKNNKHKKTKYRVLLDAGHGGGDPGSTGTKYWDPNEQRNKDRYAIQEDGMNGEMVERLIGWLKWHNEHNKYYEYDPINTVHRYKEWRDRITWVVNYFKQKENEDTKLLVSIHHDGIDYPYSNDVADHAKWVTNENGKYDLDLASCITKALSTLSIEELPVDQRYKGHPGDDPNLQNEPIRSEEKLYCIHYDDPSKHQVDSSYRGWGIMARAKCSASLVEVATITNYDEEDYRLLSSLSGQSYWKDVADMIAYLIHRGIDYFINMHP